MSAEQNKPAGRSGASRRVSALTLGLGVSAGVGFCAGLLATLGEVGALPGFLREPLVLGVIVVVASGLVIWACIPWWRTIDELARQAHYSAWLWGGSFGLVVGFFMLVFVAYLPAPMAELIRDPDPDRALANGGMVVAAGAVIGYSVAWVAFWLRRS